MVTVPLHPQDNRSTEKDARYGIQLHRRMNHNSGTSHAPTGRPEHTHWNEDPGIVNVTGKNPAKPYSHLPTSKSRLSWRRAQTVTHFFLGTQLINSYLVIQPEGQSTSNCQSLPLDIHTSSQPVPPSHFSSEMWRCVIWLTATHLPTNTGRVNPRLCDLTGEVQVRSDQTLSWLFGVRYLAYNLTWSCIRHIPELGGCF